MSPKHTPLTCKSENGIHEYDCRPGVNIVFQTWVETYVLFLYSYGIAIYDLVDSYLVFSNSFRLSNVKLIFCYQAHPLECAVQAAVSEGGEEEVGEFFFKGPVLKPLTVYKVFLFMSMVRAH